MKKKKKLGGRKEDRRRVNERGREGENAGNSDRRRERWFPLSTLSTYNTVPVLFISTVEIYTTAEI